MTPDRMRTLFGARTDDYAVQQPDGSYKRQYKALTDEVLAMHLAGEITIGLYQLDKDGKGIWSLVDLDVLKREWLDALYQAALEIRVPSSALLREFSGSKGYHLWTFTAVKVPGAKLARLGEIIKHKSGVPMTHPDYAHPTGQLRKLLEVYPKTTDLTTTTKGMGQLVKLPFGIHRKSGQRAEPIEPERIEPLTEAELDALLAPFEHVVFTDFGATGADSGAGSNAPFLAPCTPGLMGQVWSEGGRNNALFNLCKRWWKSGMTEDQVVSQAVSWAATNLIPPLPDREVIATAKSAQGRGGMDCLNPDIIPHCHESCPIWKVVHPGVAPTAPPPQRLVAVPPSTNGVRAPGPRLQVVTSEPPVYRLPLSAGLVRISAADLLNWDRVRERAMEQLHIDLPRRRLTDWDRERADLFLDLEEVAAPPEVSMPGVISKLLASWLARASDDPAAVERRSVWLDEEVECYVFHGDALIRYVRNVEREATRQLIWEIVRAAGGYERHREVPGSDLEVAIWEIPVRSKK